jgi:CheY-like chemotaxis protein
LDAAMSIRVLLATPYSDEQVIYGYCLSAEGFDVQVARNVSEMFAQLFDSPIDVVVARIPQPGTTTAPRDLVARLTERAHQRSIPTVILTSVVDGPNDDAAIRANCDGYLLLPALPDALACEVLRVASTSRIVQR